MLSNTDDSEFQELGVDDSIETETEAVLSEILLSVVGYEVVACSDDHGAQPLIADCEPYVDSRRYKYSRDELVDLRGCPDSIKFPSTIDLSADILRDLDKRVQYAWRDHRGGATVDRDVTEKKEGRKSLQIEPPFPMDNAADQPLKPSWASGKFGQQGSLFPKSPTATGLAVPQGLIRSRLVEDGSLPEDPSQRGANRTMGNSASGAWRSSTDKGTDGDRDRPGQKDREPRPQREPWLSPHTPAEPSERARMDPFDASKGSPGAGERNRDRWGEGKPQADNWRGAGGGGVQQPPQQPAPAKEAWRAGADRWGGGGAGGADAGRRERWADNERAPQGRNDRQGHYDGGWDDGETGDADKRGGRGGGGGRQRMNAQEMEAERLAFRKQLEEEQKAKQGDKPQRSRGIFDDEVDLEELMDGEQVLGRDTAERMPAKAVLGPPGFSRPIQGMKISFEDLAKKASGPAEVAAVAATAAPHPLPMPTQAVSLDELEKRLTSAVDAPSSSGLDGKGRPPGFMANAQASNALMGMLGKKPTSGAPSPAIPAAIPNVAPDANAKPSLPTRGVIPSAVLNAFGEGGNHSAGFPGLSSIWGTSSGGGAAAVGQQDLPPAATQQQEPQAQPNSQAAAAALFEQLSNAAAVGTTARPPVPPANTGFIARPLGPPVPAPGIAPQPSASNPLSALFAKASASAGQQPQSQPQPQPLTGSLQSLLQLNQINQPQTMPASSAPSRPLDRAGSNTPLADDDNLNSMLKDLGISPEPSSKPKEQERGRAGAQGWNQDKGGQEPSRGVPLTAQSLQELMAATSHQGPGQQIPMPQSTDQQANLHRLLAAAAAGQQSRPPTSMHPLQMPPGGLPPGQMLQMMQQQQQQQQQLQLQQQQQAMQRIQQQQQQLQQQQQWPPNVLQGANMQQMQQMQMIQLMQQQQAMQQQQQLRPQQGGFDAAFLARLQAGGGVPGGVPPRSYPSGAQVQQSNPMGALNMHQMNPGSRPVGGPLSDANNLARFFNPASIQAQAAAAMHHAQMTAARGPQKPG